MSRLTFYYHGTTKSGLTKMWSVLNNSVSLGQVKWFSNWRRYTFYPGVGTTFDGECLTEIADFLKAATQEHNNGTV